MELQKVINKEIDKKRITMRELSRRAGVTPTVIERLVRGERSDIKLSTAFKIADALEIDINCFRK